MCQEVPRRGDVPVQSSNFWRLTGFLTWWILMTTSQMETRAGWEAQHRIASHFFFRDVFTDDWHSNKWHHFPPKIWENWQKQTAHLLHFKAKWDALCRRSPAPFFSSGLAGGGTQEPDIQRFDIFPTLYACRIMPWGAGYTITLFDKTRLWTSIPHSHLLYCCLWDYAHLSAEVWCNPIWFGVCVYI